MVFEVGQTSQGSLELLRAWRGHGPLSRDDKLGIHPLGSHSQLSDVPRYASTDALEAYLKERGCAPVLPASSLRVQHPAVFSFPVQPPSSGFVFTAPKAVHGEAAFEFSETPRWLGPRFKRRRHRLDVDGQNTADLSSKKRRIRGELVTSRLSQPYSQPATHILNREGVESGDKRFLKMATTLDQARRIAHLHGTSFLRFSVMNRLRRRLGLWKTRGEKQPLEEEEDEEEDVELEDADIDTTAKAPWRPQSIQAVSGGKYLKPSAASGAGSSHTGSLADRHAPAKPAHGHGKMPAPRLSKPAALPLPSADFAASKKLTSPRIQPMSPELRPMSHYEELEEDGFAFLHADDESAGDVCQDSEDVYSDFGVIFGGSPTAESEDHTYEEYLDELDGISWMTR